MDYKSEQQNLLAQPFWTGCQRHVQINSCGPYPCETSPLISLHLGQSSPGRRYWVRRPHDAHWLLQWCGRPRQLVLLAGWPPVERCRSWDRGNCHFRAQATRASISSRLSSDVSKSIVRVFSFDICENTLPHAPAANSTFPVSVDMSWYMLPIVWTWQQLPLNGLILRVSFRSQSHQSLRRSVIRRCSRFANQLSVCTNCSNLSSSQYCWMKSRTDRTRSFCLRPGTGEGYSTNLWRTGLSSYADLLSHHC